MPTVAERDILGIAEEAWASMVLGDTSSEHGGDTLREDKMGVCTNVSRPLATISEGAGNVR